MEIKLKTETIQTLIKGIKESEAHLNIVIIAMAKEKLENCSLFTEICQIRDSLESFDNRLNPTIFFE